MTFWTKFIIAMVLAPFGIILSPIVILFYGSAVTLNIARAGQWTPWRIACIIRSIIRSLWNTLTAIPLFKDIAWGYATNSKDIGRLKAKKNVEYERFLEEDLSRQGASLVTRPRTSKEDMVVFRRNQMKLDVFPMMSVSGVRSDNTKVRPVIVFIYGGYFESGNKWAYNRLARQLRDHCNAVVVVPNYPTYPRGTIQEMSESIARCLMWTSENAEKYGGSREHIWVVGHSAGAYLAAYTLLRAMMAKSSGSNALPSHLLAQGRCEAPIYPLSLGGYIPYEGCKTHLNTHSHYNGMETVATPSGTGGFGSRVFNPTGTASSSKGRCNDPSRMPNPSQPAVDYRLVPRVSGCVLLAGIYDLVEQLRYQHELGIDKTSSMTAATGGYWDATNCLALARVMTSSPETFPLRPGMCPANGFHIVHGNTDTVCPVKQSLDLRDALIELEMVQNGIISSSFSGGGADLGHGEGRRRLTPTPPQLQTPYGGSFAASAGARLAGGDGFFAALSPSSPGTIGNNMSRVNSLISSDAVAQSSGGGDFVMPQEQPTDTEAHEAEVNINSGEGATDGFSEPPTSSRSARFCDDLTQNVSTSHSVFLTLCPHGVRHTDCTHRGIVLDPMGMTPQQIPYQSSTIAAIFSAIYGRPIISE